MSEYLDALRAARLEEKRLKPIRREAIRPLRAMLRGTSFGIRVPHVGTGTVFITFGPWWQKAISWDDAGNREIVRRLQLELLADVQRFVDGAEMTP